ncbi:MAG: baseplate J/gp47 family protein, partial [Roseomonas mucosa]|nr:baseplate J/gp47 family protein [Roseomonas mucosa]
MPYTIPTLRELQSQAQQDIASADLPGVDGLLRRSVLLVLSYVMAGFAYLHFGYQSWIARMAVPWTARDEFAAGWAALKGVTQKPATAASGVASFSGTPGKVAPAGTVLRRSD